MGPLPFARTAARPIGFGDVFGVTRDHMIRVPGYLPLTSRCFAMRDREIDIEPALAFKVRVGQVLTHAGVGLERHFPALGPGGGLAAQTGRAHV